MTKLLFRLSAVGALALLWFAMVAATATDTATQIAGVVIVAAPLVLPFVLKAVPAVGHYMVVTTYVVALAVAIIAGLLAHLFSFSDLNTLPGILAAAAAVYGLMQFVYQLFKQSPALAKYVT